MLDYNIQNYSLILYKFAGLYFTNLLYKDSDKSGKISAFVYNQLASQVDLERNVSLYHWRDSRKREIDFIIETEDEIFGIEVKSGTEIKLDAFKHLEWFRNNLAKNKLFTGLILYTGERTMTWSNGMFTVLINNLWGNDKSLLAPIHANFKKTDVLIIETTQIH